MKKNSLLVVLLCSASLCLGQDFAQGRGGQTFSSFNDVNLKKDFYCGWDKPLKKSSKAGLVRGTLHFKNITSGAVLLGKGQGRKTVTAWAVLEGISDETLQEIADEFAISFKQKFENIGGMSSVPSDAFKGAKNFAKAVDSQNKTEDAGQLIGRVKVKTADDMPYNRFNTLKTPGMYSKMAKDAGGDVYSYDIVVDFARFDIQASKWRTDGYGPGYDFIKSKASSDVMPQISIKQSNNADRMKIVNSNLTLVTDKKLTSTINLSKNLFYNENYALEIDAYQGKLPEAVSKGIRINNMNTGTFVIKADEKKYKEVVLKALDAYSDLLIEYIKTQVR